MNGWIESIFFLNRTVKFLPQDFFHKLQEINATGMSSVPTIPTTTYACLCLGIIYGDSR